MANWVKGWTEILVAFGTPKSERSDEQEFITALGICYAAGVIWDDFYIPHKIVLYKSGYWWPLGKQGNNYRATFAGLMAAMGNRGFESFLKWCREHPE